MQEQTGLRPEFTKLLEQYCLQDAAAGAEDLLVPCRSVVTLSGSPRHSSFRRPRLLQTSDLDELKRWIGVPDAAVKGRCLLEREQRSDLMVLRRQVKAAEVKPPAAGARLDSLRAAARAYLFGDSSAVAEAKPLLQAHFEVFSALAWIFTKVKVSAGSVLAFGPGANVLLAGELEIEEGGQIVSTGSLTVRVGTLRKTKPVLTLSPMALNHVLALLRA